MNKKLTKIILITVLGYFLLPGCNNQDEEIRIVPRVRERIGISVYGNGANATRGDATNATNALSMITSFYTWGYDVVTDNLYLGESATAGRVVTNTGSADAPVWSYTPVQFCPVNPLGFVAMTPVTEASITSVSTDSSSGTVTLTANISLYTGVEDQKDIMMASASGATKATDYGNVPFSFQHALSQIVFKGKLDGNGAITKVTIAEISLCNINRTGTLTYTSDGTWYGGAIQPASVSTPASFTLMAGDLEGYEFDVKDELEPARTYTAEDPEVISGTKSIGDTRPAVLRGASVFDLTASNSVSGKHNAWFMIPQTTTPWDGPTAIGTVPSSGTYLKIRARMEKDGVVILGNAQSDALYIPLAVNWERNKKYTYTIDFNGLNALTPITFSVTAQDWDEVEKQIPEEENDGQIKMLGALVGDIIGSVYELSNTKSTNFELFPNGTHFTDDSVMTLALAKWLLEDEAHTINYLIYCMQELGNRYPKVGYGANFMKWLQQDDPQPYNSWGNGSGMRVSPVGLYARTIDETLALAELTASVSHNHPEGVKGAQAIATSVFLCKQGKTKQEIKEYVEKTFGYNLNRTIDEIRPKYTFDVSCQGSVPEAIIAFLEGNTFEEVIRLAISLGGDSDTIAAMAGSIAACMYPIPHDIAERCDRFLTDDLRDVKDNFIRMIESR